MLGVQLDLHMNKQSSLNLNCVSYDLTNQQDCKSPTRGKTVCIQRRIKTHCKLQKLEMSLGGVRLVCVHVAILPIRLIMRYFACRVDILARGR